MKNLPSVRFVISCEAHLHRDVQSDGKLVWHVWVELSARSNCCSTVRGVGYFKRESLRLRKSGSTITSRVVILNYTSFSQSNPVNGVCVPHGGASQQHAHPGARWLGRFHYDLVSFFVVASIESEFGSGFEPKIDSMCVGTRSQQSSCQKSFLHYYFQFKLYRFAA